MTTKTKEVNITAPCVGITRMGDEVLLLPNANRETRDAYPWVYDCRASDVFEVTSKGILHAHVDNYMEDDADYDIVATRPATAEDFENNIGFIEDEYRPPVLGQFNE